MIEFLEENYISQMVSEPTRQNNILDLVITTQDNLVSNVTVGEHFGSSDHKLVRIDIRAQTWVTENKVKVPNFKRANYVEIRKNKQIYNYQMTAM